MTKMRKVAPIATTLLLAAGLVACEQEGPLERAGEQVDEAIDKVGDAVDQQGPLERAGEKLDEAVERAGEKAQQSLNHAGEEIQRATSS